MVDATLIKVARNCQGLQNMGMEEIDEFEACSAMESVLNGGQFWTS